MTDLSFAHRAFEEGRRTLDSIFGNPSMDEMIAGMQETLGGGSVERMAAVVEAAQRPGFSPALEATLLSAVENADILLANSVLRSSTPYPALPEPVEVSEIVEPHPVEPDPVEEDSEIESDRLELQWMLELALIENDDLRREKAELQQELRALRLCALMDYATVPYPDLDAEDFEERQP